MSYKGPDVLRVMIREKFFLCGIPHKKTLPRKGTLIHLTGGEAGVHPCRSKELSQRKEGSSGEKGQGFCGLCLKC